MLNALFIPPDEILDSGMPMFAASRRTVHIHYGGNHADHVQ